MPPATGNGERGERAGEEYGRADRERLLASGEPTKHGYTIRCAPSTLATMSAPIAPPIVRTIVFMPVATPVCPGGTASTIRFATEANEKPTPAPTTVAAR